MTLVPPTDRPARRLKILLPEGSSSSARETLYVLGPKHTIDLLDPNPICRCRFSRFVRRWYRCPSYTQDPKAYLDFLIDKLRREVYDVLFPTHEEVFLLSRHGELLRRYVKLAVPPFTALDRVIGKSNFIRTMEEVGLPIPASTIVRGRSELNQDWDFPCFLKLDHSTAGLGVRRIDNSQGLREAVDEFQQLGWLNQDVEIVVQQPAKGSIKGSVAGIFQHGRMVATYCEQATAFGVGGHHLARKTIHHPMATQHLETLGKYLHWHGALVNEFFYDPDNQRIEYTECNPRIGETVNATLSGVNMCQQLVRVALDDPVERLPAGQTDVKTHQGFMSLLAIAARGGNRRDLLVELGRWWAGTGIFQDSQNEMTRLREDWFSVIPALAVTLQLLCWPRSARWIVQKTVDNYSLSEQAVRKIRGGDDLHDSQHPSQTC